MATFGENLRREREMRGVSLQEISSATKIGVRFLQALENEQFDQIPGGVFTRSFIRTYARYLGLDEEQVLAEYRLVAPSSGDIDLSHLTASRPGAPPEKTRGPAAVILLATLLLGGGYLLHRYVRRTGEPPPPPLPTATAAPAAGTASTAASAPSPAPAVEAKSPSPPQTSVSVPRPVTSTPSPGTGGETEALPPAFPAEGLSLQIAATEQSWVAVEADRKTVLQRVLEAGEVTTIRARESIDVTTGNALGVVLTLNGETLQPLGRHGEVKTVHLTRNDVRKSNP